MTFEPEWSGPSPTATDGVGTGPVRVLHVDDEQGVRELTAKYLQHESDVIEVVTEPGAEPALARVEDPDERVDCVVSDYDMPGMDGLELLEALRQRGLDVPFFLFTGKGSERIASRAISAGVTDYLQKGTDTEQYTLLANRIENAVAQRRAERVAAENSRRLSQIAEVTDDVLWMFDADWSEVLFVNSAYEDVWQQSADELRADPRSFLDAVHPDDRDDVEAAMCQLSAGQSVDLEYRVVPDDGDERWVWVQGHPLFDGEVVAVTGFARDVTGRKEREERLQTFREAVENAGHSIYWTDAEGVIEYVNPAFVETTGYSREEAVGRTPSILKSGVHDEAFYADLWETVIAGEVWEAEVVNERADGERYVVDQTIAPILSADGRPERFVAVNTVVDGEDD
jgi:PAS domain S-box-containing protein